MSEIKTKHRGGDSAKMPTARGKAQQKPGVAAGSDKLGKMSWSGKLQK